MGKFHPWRKLLPRKLFRPSSPPSPPRSDNSNDAVVLHGNLSQEEIFLSNEDKAAITIQACFRAHLARRAYKALRSLVKLQALVRGVIVRRQARMALDCMHALARLQITVRARQLLLNN